MNRLALALVLLPTLAIAAPTSGALTVPKTGQDAFARRLDATWKQLRPGIEDNLRTQVANAAGKHGDLTIDRLVLSAIDLKAAPGVTVTPVTTAGGAYFGERVRLDVPRKGAEWGITIDGHVTYDVEVKVLFVKIKKRVSEDVTIRVSDLHVTESLVVEASTPPTIRKVGELDVDFELRVTTGNVFANALLFLARPVIDSMLRKQVDGMLEKLDVSLQGVENLPAKPWGTNAPARTVLGNGLDLEKLAVARAATIRSTHMPFGTVVDARMSSPIDGQGTPIGYETYPDSAIWTGHFLAGESFRHALTQDPAALANAVAALEGIRDLLDAESVGGGHLARCVVPAWHAEGKKLAKAKDSFATTVRGQAAVALENISRDQYLGVMHGLGTAHDFLQDPAARRTSAELMGRIVSYLAGHEWSAYDHAGTRITAPFVQTPLRISTFAKLAAHADPSFQKVADETADLAHVEWITAITRHVDPLTYYYKWNLTYGTTYHALRLETDPGRFMAIARGHAADRASVGHHENAYFQTVDAACIPSLAATVGASVRDELERFALRGQRRHAVSLLLDPTIEKDLHVVPLSYKKNAGAVVNKTELLAKFPVPVEKRPAADYLWQKSPFALEGTGDPTQQTAGVDLTLPYWMARYYNVLQ